jgi:2-dehydro-3-deoxyphosphogluconate aldolase/(4S)-4-hydroxy-2-oxoglutarate aldolase
MKNSIETLGELGVVPVVAIEDAKDAVPLGRALIDGGLPCAEITFRTAAAAEAIAELAQNLPQVLLGAGTILSAEQASQAVEAGAKFIVSPGFDPFVVDWCIEHQVPIMPGVATPTEISMALNKGLTILKFFPAEVAGGVKALKAIAGPFVGVKFVPTGGINPANLPDYLALPAVHACGGSWLVKRKLINEGSFDEISRLTKEAIEIVQRIRGEGAER